MIARFELSDDARSLFFWVGVAARIQVEPPHELVATLRDRKQTVPGGCPAALQFVVRGPSELCFSAPIFGPR